jgi:hypothetical protein
VAARPKGDDSGEIKETEFDITYSDPSTATHWVRSGQASFGFNEDAGGYMSCLFPTREGGQPDRCDSLIGDPNLGVPDYGRGWQSTFRDGLHSGRYNPTQAGFNDSHGTPADLSRGESCGGPGGRVTIAPYRMPIFSNSSYDWVENEDYAPDEYKEDGEDSDKDAIDESLRSQLDEVKSEWSYTGFYEDGSETVYANVGLLRHVYQVDFAHEADALLQFGAEGRKDNGKSVIDTRAIPLDLAPDATAPASLQGRQIATAEDLASGTFGYSGRVRWSFDYHHVLWLDKDGLLQEDLADVCREKVLVQVGEDQYSELYEGDPNSQMGGDPDDFQGSSDLPLMILSSGGLDELETADAVALYMPENRCNAQQVVGVDTHTGEEVYTQDRRTRVVFSANRRACKTDTDNATRLIWKDPEGIEEDRYIENDQTNIAIRIYQLGMLNPVNAPEGVFERFRMDTRILTGTPAEILAAVRQLEESRDADEISCEIRPSCEG